MKLTEKELRDWGIDLAEEKHVHAYIVDDDKAIDEESHRINFVVSSEIIDRADEIVEAQAVMDAIARKGEFEANPICLPCHMHRLDSGAAPCVGSWDIATARMIGAAGRKLVQMVLAFAVGYELAQQYWYLYSNKFMRAVSIGFRILDYRVEDKDGKRIFIVTKLELIEISCVAVGCNKQALSKVKGLGDLAGGEKGSLADGLCSHITRCFETLRAALDERLDEIAALVHPGGKDFDFNADGDLAGGGDVPGKSSEGESAGEDDTGLELMAKAIAEFQEEQENKEYY